MEARGTEAVFPARAGMNRSTARLPSAMQDVLRTRGDEPTIFAIWTGLALCSPHARG
jgi:hypothetical protein